MAVKKKPKVLAKKAKPANSFKALSTKIKARRVAYLSRRPHRSLRLSRRRDYIRPLNLPGYWLFTLSVIRVIKKNRKLFLLLTLVYALLTALLVGLASQDSYLTITDLLRETGDKLFEGDWGQVGEAGLLLTTVLSGGISETLTEGQQVYAVLIGLMTWLTTVWLLRNILASKVVKLRDGLYNSGASILSSFLVFLMIIIQLLPLAIALIGYSAASSTGLLNGGVEAMLFWLAAGLLTMLSIYWVTGTFLALVAVTLPGMYPFQAIQVAGDLVTGRRVKILFRVAWLILGILLTWIVVGVPVVLLDTWLKGLWPAIEWLPVVPVFMLVLSSLTIVWSASYVYLLYRGIIDNDKNIA